MTFLNDWQQFPRYPYVSQPLSIFEFAYWTTAGISSKFGDSNTFQLLKPLTYQAKGFAVCGVRTLEARGNQLISTSWGDWWRFRRPKYVPTPRTRNAPRFARWKTAEINGRCRLASFEAICIVFLRSQYVSTPKIGPGLTRWLFMKFAPWNTARITRYQRRVRHYPKVGRLAAGWKTARINRYFCLYFEMIVTDFSKSNTFQLLL